MNRILLLFILGIGLIYSCGEDGSGTAAKPSFEVLKDTMEIDGEMVILLENINERVKLRSILPDVKVMREYWDFDRDGEFDKFTKEPRYVFPEPGDYKIKYCYNDPTNPANCTIRMVRVRVKGGAIASNDPANTDNNATSSTDTNPDELEDTPPPPVFINVKFSLEDEVDQGTSISLRDNSSPASEVNSRQWFIDGKSYGSGSTLNYTFNEVGFHNVRLCVNGTSNCIRKMIEVKGKEKPKQVKIVAKMSGPREVNQGEIVTFRNTSTPASYVRDYTWTVNKKTYTSSEIQFTLDEPGNYTVKLCVNGKADCTTSKLRVKKIKEAEPDPVPVTVLFNAPSSAEIGQQIQVSDMSTPGSGVKSRNWTINGRTYTGQSETVTFDKAGEYDIKLCINGNKDCMTKKIVISKAPEASPEITVNISGPSSGKVGESVTFQDMSSPNANVDQRVWRVDNKTYTTKNISLSFDSPGTKEIELCVNGTTNCYKTTINIEEAPSTNNNTAKVTVDFTLPAQVTIGEKIQLKSNASPQSAVTSTVWYVNSRKVFNGSTYTFNADKEGTFEITLEANGIKKHKKIKVVSKAATVAPDKPADNVNTGTYPENDEDFYCNTEKSGGISSSDRCGETFGDKKWSGACTIEFTPKKRCALQEVMISTNASGSVKIKISNGQSYVEQDEFYVNRGNSTIALEDLYYTMEPNWTYFLTLTPVKGSGGKVPELENSGPCNPTDRTDSNLKINYKNNFVIYDLKYCYQ